MGKKSFPRNAFGKIFMTIGERLREERERLGMSQPALAAIAKTTKQTLFSWETGKTAPDGFQLAALNAVGIDVLFVVTGQRSQVIPPQAALPREQQALLNSYALCTATAKKNLLQTAALLASGSKPTGDAHVSVRAVGVGNIAAGRDVVTKRAKR